MTQRVFDIENEKDMDLLWSILPDDINKIKKHTERINHFYDKSDVCYTGLININWHDKTEITRPENYENMIGYVCWFWDDDPNQKELGILTKIDNDDIYGCNYKIGEQDYYKNVAPAKKSELKFYKADK